MLRTADENNCRRWTTHVDKVRAVRNTGSHVYLPNFPVRIAIELFDCSLGLASALELGMKGGPCALYWRSKADGRPL